MAQQGGERLIRAGQRVQAHHLRGGTGRRSHHPELHLLLRRLYLGGGHAVPLRQHKRHGSQTVTQALENSCNQSFIQIGARLGKQAFCDYFAAFGLREPTGIDLPAEPKKSLYYTADRMGPVELASCAFGQSSKISYLEMAAAVCAVVNGGKLMQPYLVSDILAPDGSILQHNAPVCKRQVIQPQLPPPCGR